MANVMQVVVEDGYESLFSVLCEALAQAQSGKGKERHAADEPFANQVICEVSRRVGLGYPLGQATKKTFESQSLPGERGVSELLGAINYTAAAILVRREQDAAAVPDDTTDTVPLAMTAEDILGLPKSPIGDGYSDTVPVPQRVDVEVGMDQVRKIVIDELNLRLFERQG